MADFSEWYEATGGGAAEESPSFGHSNTNDHGQDETTELSGSSSYRERDAVLFIIDSSVLMFKNGTGVVAGSAMTSAVQCALRFYQDKVVTSERDLVGLVLYNTHSKMNVYDFPHTYVFHEFDTPSAARVQELDVLSKAGNTSAPVYQEFVEHIGHTSTQCVLSDVLWAAQHMFHHLPSKSVSFKRIFLFTCDEDPSCGVSVELNKCTARVKDLYEAGVAIEVFVHGSDVTPTSIHNNIVSSSLHPSSAIAPIMVVPSSLLEGNTHPTCSPPLPSNIVKVGCGTSPPSSSNSCSNTAPPINRSVFWDVLLRAPFNDPLLNKNLDIGEGYVGSVHVNNALSSFQTLLSDVRIRSYPQRSVARLMLSIGVGSNVPTMSVKVFLPVQPCSKPRFVWLEGSTNSVVTSERRLLLKCSGGEVVESDILHATTAAGVEVKFTKEEVSSMKRFGEVGLRIIAFKSASDALKMKYCVSRTAFIHLNKDVGGVGPLKLFVQLYRTLLATKKVAIAELVARAGTAPRLVALLPSRDTSAPGAPVAGSLPEDEAIQGCGFHMIYIPFADDLRCLTFPPCTPATDELVNSAKKIIRKMSVSYDPLAIPNPALQRQYCVLQQLAVMDYDVQSSTPKDHTLPDKEGMSKFSDLFDDFNKRCFPAGYKAEDVVPLSKGAKPPPTSSEVSSIDFDALEAKGQLGSLTIAYLKQYLALRGESAEGATLKHDLVDRVAFVVKKNRGVKRERDTL